MSEKLDGRCTDCLVLTPTGGIDCTRFQGRSHFENHCIENIHESAFQTYHTACLASKQAAVRSATLQGKNSTDAHTAQYFHAPLRAPPALGRAAVVVLVVHDPQRLLDQQQVVLDHLGPVLDVADFLYARQPAPRAIPRRPPARTLSFPRAPSAMPPHCLVVLDSCAVLVRSWRDCASSAAALPWIVAMRSRSSRSTLEPSASSSPPSAARASSAAG